MSRREERMAIEVDRLVKSSDLVYLVALVLVG